jgi:hypothetical protein
MTKRTNARNSTMRIAFCGMMTALSVVVMLLGGLVPVMLYVSPLAAGLLLLVVLIEYGKKAAWLTWLATALCVLLMGVDKEAAFFYVFIGYYPVLKWSMDRRIANKGLRTAAKLLLFTVMTGLMYLLLALLFPALMVVEAFGGIWMLVLFIVLVNFCLLMYDRALLPMAVLYDRRLRTHLKFLHR